VVRGIVNKNCLVGFHEEKQLITIHKADRKAIVYTRLQGKFSVGIDGRVEGVVRRVYVVRQDRRRDFLSASCCKGQFPRAADHRFRASAG
jgi:hypothetical protein